MFPKLETHRLLLREIVEDDAGEILKCFSDGDVLRYYGQKPLESIDQVKQIIKNFSRGYEEKQLIKWGIQLKGKEKLIGTIGFQEWSSQHKKANVSYALFPDYWNKGYATEAVHEAISYGFNELHLKRIGAVVFTQNSGSITLLSKVGFKKEGTLREYMYQNDIPFDTYIYSLLRGEAKI
ncbi:GNAT family protein [Priestia megaterium]|uniref:GNAT family N-acetyltransferase n=1 Tax=Priestia megaterium TaxID=1404 RepID=UPI002A69A586|nr:GNAT family protein [Priestia megaterium]MDY0940699.1 GNAT family protein [Priestia megaterium]